MKLSISRNELYNKLAVVQKVIASKSAVPVAENFLFRIEGNILKIVATDLETTLSTSIDLYSRLRYASKDYGDTQRAARADA